MWSDIVERSNDNLNVPYQPGVSPGVGNARYQQGLNMYGVPQNLVTSGAGMSVSGNIKHQQRLNILNAQANQWANTVRHPYDRERQVKFVDRVGVNQYIQQ